MLKHDWAFALISRFLVPDVEQSELVMIRSCHGQILPLMIGQLFVHKSLKSFVAHVCDVSLGSQPIIIQVTLHVIWIFRAFIFVLLVMAEVRLWAGELDLLRRLHQK